jgi:HPr kinase/phosphorylase
LEIQIHGALVEVLNLGVLLLGKSGVGKSETALELVRRGFLLVADDVVRLRTDSVSVEANEEESELVLLGRAPDLIRHYMEIRGIGLLYIPELYGTESVCLETQVNLVCHLEQWREGGEYERLGLDRPSEILAGVAVPSLVLPVRPSANMATLVEVAVRDQLQRRLGINSAERLDRALKGRSAR